MRIGVVTQHPFPDGPDHRGRLIVKALACGGHDVVVFTPAATAQSWHGNAVEVREPKGSACLLKPFPVSPYWRHFLLRESKRGQVDCLLTKELRLAVPAWMASKEVGAKFVMDLAENYPAMVEVERNGQLLLPVIRGTARLLESFCAHRADLVAVVTESNRARLVSCGVPPERIVVVNNTPELEVWPRRQTRPLGPLQLVFVGLISKVRGLDRLIRAIANLHDPTAVHLHIIGTGPELCGLERICNDLRMNSGVTFLGWMDRGEIEASLSRFDVGVIPHVISEHTNTTIPGKLFDYMAAGLPVLTTAMRPCEEVLRRVECGWVMGDDTDSMARALQELLSTPAHALWQAGERGRRAVQDQYNWTVDSSRLLRALDMLCERDPETVALSPR